MNLHLSIERWPLIRPLRITGFEWQSVEVLVVSLEKEGRTGRGEAAGVYYRGEHPASMIEQIESLGGAITAGIDRDSLREIMPRGGARNALDCALWDLQAKLEERPAWQIAALVEPRPLLTTFTCGADEPNKMAAAALAYQGARAIKLKLTGEAIDEERVRAVRGARQDVWLSIDANQGFTLRSLEELMPLLVEMRVALIEQPFPIGQEALLDGFRSPIPIAADESAQGIEDIPAIVGRFNVVNIKLDKCGGLTEGIAMARSAVQAGLDVMVGNMPGTSLSMAPAFLLGHLCSIVDLDGPVFLTADRANPVEYTDGFIKCPAALWGGIES